MLLGKALVFERYFVTYRDNTVWNCVFTFWTVQLGLRHFIATVRTRVLGFFFFCFIGFPEMKAEESVKPLPRKAEIPSLEATLKSRILVQARADTGLCIGHLLGRQKTSNFQTVDILNPRTPRTETNFPWIFLFDLSYLLHGRLSVTWLSQIHRFHKRTAAMTMSTTFRD